MPRKRRPDQGPPIPRTRNACVRCKEKRYKCSEDRPCLHCAAIGLVCVAHLPKKRRHVDRSDRNTCVQPESDSFQQSQGLLTGIDTSQDIDLSCLHKDDYLSPMPTELVRAANGRPSQAYADDLLLQGPQIAVGNEHNGDVWQYDHITSILETPIILSRPSTPTSSILLDRNPLYKELWYHYTEVLSCLHSPHEITSNPIVKILSPVAQCHDPLLAILLASSLENYRSLRGLPPDEELLGTLVNHAVGGVQNDLVNAIDGKVGELTLATVIALCDFEVVARKRATTSSWRIHLEGAKRIITLQGGPRKRLNKSDFYQFLLKWLAYFDVMSSVTSMDLDAQPLFEGKYWLKSDAGEAVHEDDFRLDPYMGFLQDVIPFFLEVGLLTRQKRRLTSDLNLREAHDLHMRCRLLEHSLKATLGTISGQSYISDAKAEVLINCHDAFVFAIMIHLYRRVEGLPSSSPDVRTSVTLGLHHIADSCNSDQTEIDSSLLFPLFTFGCEADTEADRAYILNRMTALGALGLGNVDRAIEVLLGIWEINSHGTTTSRLEWDEILRMFNWEVNLA